MQRQGEVPFVDLAARHAEVGDAVEKAVIDVLRSGHYVGGPAVAEAEALAARWLGRGAAVGVASGTDALILALQALGVGPGDEVIVPALTFFATAGAVRATGADVAIADVGPDGLLDVASAASLRSARTRAIVPVHLFGSACAAPDLGVPVVDDAAQAIGAEPAPTGTLVALSTYPTKTWGSAGDGGFVAGDDLELLDRVRRLGNHGAVEPSVHHTFGGHVGRASRLDGVQAAILVAHGRVLEERVARRRRLAERYDAGLPASVRPLPRSPGSAVHQYCVLSDDRDGLREHLRGRGIGTAVYYPRPLDRQPALASARSAPCPTAQRLCAEIVALPVHDASEAQVDRVIAALAEWR